MCFKNSLNSDGLGGFPFPYSQGPFVNIFKLNVASFWFTGGEKGRQEEAIATREREIGVNTDNMGKRTSMWGWDSLWVPYWEAIFCVYALIMTTGKQNENRTFVGSGWPICINRICLWCRSNCKQIVNIRKGLELTKAPFVVPHSKESTGMPLGSPLGEGGPATLADRRRSWMAVEMGKWVPPPQKAYSRAWWYLWDVGRGEVCKVEGPSCVPATILHSGPRSFPPILPFV